MVCRDHGGKYGLGFWLAYPRRGWEWQGLSSRVAVTGTVSPSGVRLVSVLAVAPGEARAGFTDAFCRARASEMCLDA